MVATWDATHALKLDYNPWRAETAANIGTINSLSVDKCDSVRWSIEMLAKQRT